MLNTLIEDFRTGKAHGVKIIVIPDDADGVEAVEIGAVLSDAMPDDLLIGVESGDTLPHYSLAGALRNAYLRPKGRPGAWRAAFDRAKDKIGDLALDGMGGVVGVAAHLTLDALPQSPIKSVLKSPYSVEAVHEAIGQLLKVKPLVLCIKRAHIDSAESIRFVMEHCVRGDNLRKGDNRFLIVLYIRQRDLDNELWKGVQDFVADEGLIEFLHYRADGGASESPLVVILREADDAAIRVLMALRSYMSAYEAEVCPRTVLTKAIGSVSRPLQWLEEKGVVQRIGDDGELLVLPESYDWTDLRDAVDDVIDTADTDDEYDDEDVADSQPVVEAARSMFTAVIETDGRTQGNFKPLLELAVEGRLAAQAMDLAGRTVQALAEARDHDELLRLRPLLRRAFRRMDLWESAERQDVDAIQAGMRAFGAAFDALACEPWGLVQAEVAGMIRQVYADARRHLPWAILQHLEDVADGDSGNLLLTTRRGRVKLVSYQHSGFQTKRRGLRGKSLLSDPDDDGTLSELYPVSGGHLMWAFCSDQSVYCYPIGFIDAKDHDGGYCLPAQDVSICLELRPPEDVVTYGIPPKPVAPGYVVLLSETGQAAVIDSTALPTSPRARVALPVELLSSRVAPRWSVFVQADEDLFVGTTDNKVLRVPGTLLPSRSGAPAEPIIHLDGDARLAAACALPPSSGGNPQYLFVATTGGYGKSIDAREFSAASWGDVGVVAQSEGKRSGSLCTIEPLTLFGDVVLGTAQGEIIRIFRSDIPLRNRTGVGVKLIDLLKRDQVVCGCAM
ncbi:MAG: hypothetical protein GC159_08085 [Phycisphaera sp.]|nr:hypothetical protein [Phycisphaera sp.]